MHEHVPGNLWQMTFVRDIKLLEQSPTIFVSDNYQVATQVTYS